MKKNVVIIGAGAIGRGYLPLVLNNDKYNFVFIDQNLKILNLLKKKKYYFSYKIKNNLYEKKKIFIKSAFHINQLAQLKLKNLSLCFVCIGPRNIKDIIFFLKTINTPIIVCENDPETVNEIKKSIKNKKVFFAVPDVITSNTSPKKLLKKDQLSIVSEDGELYIEKGPRIYGELKFLSRKDLLKIQWTAKLYLHNTPHCIAAYLGSIINVKYIHNAMKNQFVRKIVEGSMNEMLKTLKLNWDISHSFLEWYAQKEINRFKNTLLFDPISRVAREPLRKLEINGRLIGAAQLCLYNGVFPNNILKGIVSAFMFENHQDADNHIELLQNSMSPEHFNQYILGLRTGEPLDLLLKDKLNQIRNELILLRKFKKNENY
jgi:mannitol-1-phosphate/altronate dehydrogenase